jgi:hypothetical protein
MKSWFGPVEIVETIFALNGIHKVNGAIFMGMGEDDAVVGSDVIVTTRNGTVLPLVDLLEAFGGGLMVMAF